jgi:hypothetical protein
VKGCFVKKGSLARRIDAFFTANPGEGLPLSDACLKFDCTPEQFADAVKKVNHRLGLGLGVENYYRLGVSRGAERQRNGAHSVPIRANAASSSIFTGHAQRVRLPAAAPLDQSLLSVRREGGSVVVSRLTVQETEEWKERERQRRARQVLPKPPAGAKTRSKKLLELVGNDQEAQ